MRIRDFVLESTSLWNGVLLGIVAGCVPLVVLMGLAALSGSEFLTDAAWVVGIGAIPLIAVWIYFTFLGRVKRYHRAVLTYFDRRSENPAHERPEGQLFIFDFLDMVDFVEYDMRVQTLNVPSVHVETQDDTKVEVLMSVQWGPRPGALWHYGNMQPGDIVPAIINAVHEGVRAYGITRKDLDELVSGRFAEAMKRFIPEYINRRSNGVRCSLEIELDPTTNEFVAEWRDFPVDPNTPEKPWGIVAYSAELKDYVLPQNITDASSEIKEAAARKAAAENLVDTTIEAIDKLGTRGIPPLAALSGAQTIVTPDRAGIHVHSVAGWEPVAQAVMQGVAAIVSSLTGKPIPPPTQPSTKENADG